MVLINNLTIDEINAALLHLQRARTEVVGGTKEATVQNITISNKGGGSTVDYAPTITALSNRIDKNTDEIESVEDELDRIQTTLEQLSDNGISSMTFDPVTRQLQINTQDGEVYFCNITSESITLNFDATTNKLTLYMGGQIQEVTLPAQVQSDWTQTDSTQKDFIKNKIPIWITSGSADDNMSPVNVVEAGNTRPVTSGGVAQFLKTDTTETQIGFYGNPPAPLYRRLLSIPADSFTLGQQVSYQLSSEFSNFIIVRLEAFLTKQNFTINCALGEWLSVYMETRTKLNVKQNLTSNPVGMTLVVWVDYVKS